MKTRCLHCLSWIAWSDEEMLWFHIHNGNAFCSNGRDRATRDPNLPLIDLTEDDKQRLRP